MLKDLNNYNNEKPVLVIGAASLDIVGKKTEKFEMGTSNPAEIRTSLGGTARNFAENLARLGQSVILITVLGKDKIGRQLLRETQKAGVNMDTILRTKEYSTGSYLAIVSSKSELDFALDDMRAITLLTPEWLRENSNLFDQAGLLFIDANLQPDTLEEAMNIAKNVNLPVAADPTSGSLTGRLKPHLSQIHLITPNQAEASILCDLPIGEVSDDESGLKAAKFLVSQGVELAIVTLAEFGVSYATSSTNGHIPAIRTQIVDPTGGGDALSAAVVFALLNGIPEDEAVRLGVSAASLTLRHQGAVHPELTLELLYDQLI